jgi:hypothetical protein
MDDLSYLVHQTYRHQEGESLLEEEYWEPDYKTMAVPESSGIFFHVETHGGTFVIRTLVSENLKATFTRIQENPEEYPSLRLIQNGEVAWGELEWFETEHLAQAEMIHERLGQRRFPLKEESVCNISDPGFSWWLEVTPYGFSLHPKIKHLSNQLIQLGPIADMSLASRRWREMSEVFSLLPLKIEMSVENTSLSFLCTREQWLSDEIAKVFVQGIVSKELEDVFRILSKRCSSLGLLETSWYFLNEVAVTRRFWLQVTEGLKLY